jgi:hypothetical protein
VIPPLETRFHNSSGTLPTKLEPCLILLSGSKSSGLMNNTRLPLDEDIKLSELPVLIICYARTSNVIALINQLQNLGIRNIFIAIDGAKSKNAENAQLELIKYLKSPEIRFHDCIRIWKRNKNLGIAVSVITAIDWFFSQVEYGAILEDDLVPEDSFFTYLHHFLKLFKPNSSITLISGNKAQALNCHSGDLCLTNYPQTWGWGTWRDRWLEIRFSAYSRDKKCNFSLSPVRNFWCYGTKRVLVGKVDTWDIPLAHFMYKNKKTSVLPPVNLVSNFGNDIFASHTLEQDDLLHQDTTRISEMPMVNIEVMLKGINIINRLLEIWVFGIKRRHAFLPFYSIFNFRRGFLMLGSLEKRLSEVSIPSS